MYGLELINEVERLHGAPIGENEGVFILDINAYFPYSHIDLVSLDFEVSKDMTRELHIISEQHDFNASLRKNDYILNHRYPNKNYVTMSEKSGRKTGKHGYSIVAPLDVLNEIKYLTVDFRVGDFAKKFVAPLDMHLTQEKPCAALNFKIDASYDDLEEQITIRTETPCADFGYGCWLPAYYKTNEKDIDEMKAIFGEDKVILLTTNEKKGAFEQTIKVPASSKEQVSL